MPFRLSDNSIFMVLSMTVIRPCHFEAKFCPKRGLRRLFFSALAFSREPFNSFAVLLYGCSCIMLDYTSNLWQITSIAKSLGKRGWKNTGYLSSYRCSLGRGRLDGEPAINYLFDLPKPRKSGLRNRFLN